MQFTQAEAHTARLPPRPAAREPRLQLHLYNNHHNSGEQLQAKQ